MASVQHLVEDAENLIDEILTRTWNAQCTSYLKHRAAIKIQSHYRGYRFRQHLKYLHEQATVLQKYTRGFLVRLHLPEMYHAALIRRFYYQYSAAAIRIQSTWRGYWARTHDPNCFSYYKLKRWLRDVQYQNQQMREQMAVMRRDALERHMERIEEESQQWVMFIVFKLHHLLSTSVSKGIFSAEILKDNYGRVEELIRSLRYSKYMKKLRQLYQRMKQMQKPRKTILRGRLARCEKYWYEKNLDEFRDPIVYPKPQNLPDVRNDAGKRFVLSPKFYTHEIYMLGPYEEPIRHIVRDLNPAKNISVHDFKLYGVRLDYYVDLWDQLVLCEEHYIPNPYEAGPVRWTLKNSQPRTYSVTNCHD